MSGPAAGIIFPEPLTEDQKAIFRSDIQKMATLVEGTDFWIKDVPFCYILGPEYEGALEDYVEEGYEQVIGWKPKDELTLVAFTRRSGCHLYLGQLCLHFVKRFGGLIDFSGALTPPMPKEMNLRMVNEIVEGHLNWKDYEPYYHWFSETFPGKIYSIPNEATFGKSIRHVGDQVFMEAWLNHPQFHMTR